MSELKPCPFCGSGAAYTQILGNYERPHEVYCSTCDGGITEGRSKDGVIHNWNNRPIEDELRARIADLEEFKAIVEGCGFKVLTEPPVLNHPERKILQGHGVMYVPTPPEVQE